MESIKRALSLAFSWKKHPGGVFFIAIPLVVIALGLHWLVALHKYRVNGDPVFLFIVGAGTLAIGFILWQLYQSIKLWEDVRKVREELEQAAEEAKQKLKRLEER